MNYKSLFPVVFFSSKTSFPFPQFKSITLIFRPWTLVTCWASKFLATHLKTTNWALADLQCKIERAWDPPPRALGKKIERNRVLNFSYWRYQWHSIWIKPKLAQPSNRLLGNTQSDWLCRGRLIFDILPWDRAQVNTGSNLANISFVSVFFESFSTAEAPRLASLS